MKLFNARVYTVLIALFFVNLVSASTWVPIRVGEITTFTPLPFVEELDNIAFGYGTSVSVSVGSTADTEAYYYRSYNKSTGDYGAWQCATGSQVAQQGNKVILSNLSGGTYQVEVSACMTGGGCDISKFKANDLVCSKTAKSDPIELMDTGTVQSPSPSSTKSDVVASTAAEFRVNESGAATYTVPIALPKGTAGVKPQLALTYSSMGGNGYVGHGWNISGLSAITRCPKNFAQDGKISGVNLTKSDRLCLDGQRLVTDKGSSSSATTDIGVSDSSYWSSTKTYHTEIDSFARIKPHYNSGILRAFTVETKSGEVHYYGQLSGGSSYISGTSELGQSLAASFKDKSGNVDNGADAFVNARNSNDARMWALKAIKDVKGNYILFTYYENKNLGEHYIDTVEYTGNLNTGLRPYAYVDFDFGGLIAKKPKTGWLAGNPVTMRKLLKKVVVKESGQAYRHYSLDWRESDKPGLITRLNKITECVGSTCLKPLKFTWREKEYYGSDNTFRAFNTNGSQVSSTPNHETAKVFDITGDGIADIVYADGSDWRVKKGPLYNTSERLYWDKAEKPEHAKIFDADGDGILDLLVAGSTSDYWSILGYKKNVSSSSCYFPDCQASVSVKRIHTNIKATSLTKGTLILDVDGDGLSDIVTTSTSKLVWRKNNGTGSFGAAKDALTIATDWTFSYDGSIANRPNLKNASALDVNGDGRSDIIFRIGKTTYQCAPGHNICDPEHGGTPVTSWTWKLFLANGSGGYYEHQTLSNSKDFNYRVVDLNGDGLSDIIYPTGSTSWNYQLSTGKQLLEPKAVYSAGTTTRLTSSSGHQQQAVFVDVTRDGMTDLLLPQSNGTYWSVYAAAPISSSPSEIKFRYAGKYDYDENKYVQFGDANGDGKIDLFQTNGNWSIHHGGYSNVNEDVITAFSSSFGVKTSVQYSYITDPSVYFSNLPSEWIDDNNKFDPDYISPQSGFAVVAKATTDTRSAFGSERAARNSVAYAYGDLLINKMGRGNLGFGQLLTIDLQTCDTKEETYYIPPEEEFGGLSRPERITINKTDLETCVTTKTEYWQKFPYTGMPKRTVQKLGTNGPLISKSETTSRGKITTHKRGVFPYVKGSREYSYGLNAALTSSSAQSRVDSSFTYDTFGNVLTTKVTEYDPSDTANNFRQTVTTNTYGSSDKYKRFGRLATTKVTKKYKKDGSYVAHKAGDTYVTRNSSFSYYSNLMLKTETIEPANSKVKLTTTHYYDKFGNKEKTVTSGASKSDGSSSQSRTSITTWASQRGNYVVSETDTYGNKVTYDPVNSSGATNQGIIRKITVSKPNGITEVKHLNLYGQLTSSEVTGSSSTAPTIKTKVYQAYCGSSGVDCHSDEFSAPYYRVLESAPGAPEKQTFFDKWGRQVGSKVKSFNNNWTYTATMYDEQGRVLSQSVPKENGVSSDLTTYQYDKLGRVVSESGPTGTKTISYDYNRVAQTDESGFKRTKTTNYLGLLAKVTERSSANELLNIIGYRYSANGDLITTKLFNGENFSHIQVQNEYDDFGRKISTDDRDKGKWTYSYNAFGELVSQTNSDNQTVTFAYDEMGRKLSRKEADGYTRWVYDSGNYAAGKLSSVSYYKNKQSASGTPTHKEAYTYRNMGLLESKTTTFDNESFTTTYGYDELNRKRYTIYPDGNFTVKHTYRSNGFPDALINASPQHSEYGKVYQRVTNINARNQVTNVTYGNGVSETKVYEADTGRLKTLLATRSGSTVHRLDYTYYAIGHLKSRTNQYGYGNGTHNFLENFYYDSRQRLDYRKITQGGKTVKQDYNYSGMGNFKYKQGLGHYNYSGGKLQSVTTGSNSSGTTKYDFDYDGRGNITSDGNRSFVYASYDKPLKITKGSTVNTFDYDHNRQMYKQLLTKGGKTEKTIYVDGIFQRKHLTSGVIESTYNVGNTVVTTRSNGSQDTLYLLKDNLGSAISITNAKGSTVQHLTYDPWGKQGRIFTSSVLLDYSLPSDSNGYTGHKMLQDVGIIHMNGRIYDSTLGRFLQADPFIQAPGNSQSYNRYSYVLNNPMSYTDPSGYFFSKLWKGIKKFASVIIVAVASYYCAGTCTAAMWAAIGGAAGATGAALNGGNILTGALVGAFTGGIGAAAGQGLGAFFANGIAGGIASKVQGGKFGHGFWSAGLGSAIGGGYGKGFGKVVTAAVVGGTISKLTGGKFANGAVSAAFMAAIHVGTPEARKPTEQEVTYAKLANDVYDPQGNAIDGYEMSGDLFVDPDSGLQSALYVNQDTGHSVLAFAGTNGASDWIANIRQAFGLESAQYTQAMVQAQAVHAATNGNVQFVGHSLGGGLASASAIVTGGSATVFNAAGVNSRTVGGLTPAPGSITHFQSSFDGLQMLNSITPVKTYGEQVALGPAGWHPMGGVCQRVGC